MSRAEIIENDTGSVASASLPVYRPPPLSLSPFLSLFLYPSLPLDGKLFGQLPRPSFSCEKFQIYRTPFRGSKTSRYLWLEKRDTLDHPVNNQLRLSAIKAIGSRRNLGRADGMSFQQRDAFYFTRTSERTNGCTRTRGSDVLQCRRKKLCNKELTEILRDVNTEKIDFSLRYRAARTAGKGSLRSQQMTLLL